MVRPSRPSVELDSSADTQAASVVSHLERTGSSTLSILTLSMTTGGGVEFSLTVLGLTTATPSCVGNQSSLLSVLIPAGDRPPLHSALIIPSDLPNAIEVIVFIAPSANLFNSSLLTRYIPRLDEIQNWC